MWDAPLAGSLRLKEEIARELFEDAADREAPAPGAREQPPSFLEERGDTDVTLLTGEGAED